MDETWRIDASGFFDFKTAQVPDTWGAAIEVPFQLSNPPPGTEELIEWPGAIYETKSEMLEPVQILSESVEAPTLNALDMQAGNAVAFVYPSFPVAMIVGIFTPRRLSMAALYAG